MLVPTKTTTVLFTDMVASVETADRIGPHAADRLRREHDQLLSEVVAQYGGQLVKRLGDGIMATFDSASQAVTASVAIQQAIHHHNRRLNDGGIFVRIGISGGDVTVENGDCFGAPVAEAARLCEAAKGGQVLASELVRATTRGMVGAAFRPIGSVSLKGFSEPLEVVEITWEAPAASRTPLPARLLSDTQFVGRRDELSLLDRAFEEVVAGRGRQVVLVQGEPGIGKSALAVQAARGWHAAGASIGFGGCDSELSMPYAPVLTAIDHLVRHAPGYLLAKVAERHGPAVLHLAPAVAGRVAVASDQRPADREVERYLGLAAAVDLLATLGEDSPVALILEDLHWADAATLMFLRHLCANVEYGRVLVVTTFRDTDLPDGHPLMETLAALRRQEGVVRLALSGLDVSDVSRLVTLLGGDRIVGDPTRIARKLVAETTGNPFYVCELINHLAESGRLSNAQSPEALWDPRDPQSVPDLPASVLEVVGSRVGRLGKEAIDVLTLAAAIGMEFDLKVLCPASGMSEEELITLLGPACRAQVIREMPDPIGHYSFAHALVAHSLLQRVGAARRAVLHQKVALALEQVPEGHSSPAALAYHWGAAGYSLNAARARDYARQAADEAMEALAPDDAAGWYERALQLDSVAPSSDTAGRIDILTRLGVAQCQAGDAGYRQTLLRAAHLARTEQDAERLARAMVASNRGMFTDFGKVDWEKVDLLESALSITPADDLRNRSELLAVLANELTYNNDYQTRRAYSDEALSLARQVGDRTLLFRVMNLVFHAIWSPDTLPERLAMSTESLALAEQVGDPGIRFWAEHRHYINLLQAGMVDEADGCLHRHYELAERLEQPLHRWVARFSNAARLLFGGEYARAERMAVEALRFGEESAQPEADSFFKLEMMTVFWQSGRPFDIRLGERLADERPGAQSVLGGLALLAADSGSSETALRLLDRSVVSHFADLHPNPGYLTGLLSFAEAAILLRHRPAAELLYGVLSPWSEQVGFDGNTSTGPVMHYVAALAALLGQYDEALALFEVSTENARRIAGPFFEARTLLEWGRALIERGAETDRPAAMERLDQSIAIAEQKQYPVVAERGRALRRTIA